MKQFKTSYFRPRSNILSVKWRCFPFISAFKRYDWHIVQMSGGTATFTFEIHLMNIQRGTALSYDYDYWH